MIKVKKRKFLLLPGDGIGPEVVGEVKKIINWYNKNKSLDFEIDEELVGGASYEKHGAPITDEVFYKALESEAVILGAVGGPKWDDLEFSKKPERALLKLRKELKLFANLRPAICFKQLVDASSLKPDLVSDLDLLFVRELTGGIYFGEPRGIKPIDNGERKGINTHVYTSSEIERVARVAFDLARKRNKKVTSCEKSNVMEAGQLWKEEVKALHEKEYTDIELNHMLADNCAMQLVRYPKQFDVIVTDNLFGDMLSDEAAMLTGSLGLLPSASLGSKDKNGKKHMVHMQVYNKGGSHPYELNTYSSTTKELQKEEQLDEYGSMRSDKSSHDTGGMRISNADAADARERAVKKSAEKRASLAGERAKKKSAEKRDKLSNIIKKNTIQKGKFKGYMTDEVNQGEEKMEIDWTKNPFAQAKAMKEGAFKRMATDDAEEQRLKDQKKAKKLSAKKDKEEKETDPGLKEGLLQEGVAKNTLDIYQAAKDAKDKKSLKSMERQMDKAVNKANAKLKEELEGLPELDAMDYEMWEAYQSPTKNNYTDKELRQAKGIAFDKRYKGGNMTGAAKAMEKIKKGLSDHPVASKALRQANEEYMRESYLDQFDGVESMQDVFEMSYKEKFEAMLKKTGKKLSDMSDEEKKKFFNKVDDTHDAVNEASAFKDAARDYAKDDKKGLAPLKKDAPKVSDAKNAKEIEHIVPQMRKAISVGKKVQFKDGKHHTVSKAHAAKFLNKYMSGKPADKEKMQSHAHASHKNFMDHAK